MSAEHSERRPNGIRVTITESLIKLSEQSSMVQETMTQALKNGSVDLPAVIAALELSGKLSATMQSFLENQGGIIFQEGQSIQPTAIDGKEDKDESSLPEGPKTFGGLLRAKIDNELLPANNGSFTKSEIFEAAKNKKAVRKAASAEGFDPRKTRFTRQEAINILYRVFTTPSGAFKKKQESFSVQEIRVSFFPTNSGLLSQLIDKIGYDWTQNPTIDYQTAMELRGLAQLEKVLTGEKVARKGRPGAQFERKSVFPSTPSTESALSFSNQP